MWILTALDFAIIALYLAVVIGIGWAARRKVSTAEDYYMGGRRFGRAMMIMYAFGAGTHADNAVGVAGQSYKLGMTGIWYQWILVFNTPFFWLLSPVFRRARCMTTADFFELRYGPSLGVLYACMGLVINWGYLGMALLGAAKLIEALTGGHVSLMTSMLLMTVAFLSYGILGGVVAAIWNDFLQGGLTILMSFLLLPFAWYKLGGLEGVRASIPDPERVFRLITPGEIGLFWIVATIVNQMFSVVAQPHIMSNNAAGRTELDNRIGFCVGVTLKRVCTVAWALAGVLAIGIYGPGKYEGDHVFGVLVRDLLPAGFAGLMIASIMASVMDNGAVMSVGSAALFTRNILKGKTLAPERELWISRIFTGVFAVGSIGFASAVGDVPSAIRLMWNIVPLIGIAFWLGLWWRRANRYGAWASFLAATGTWMYGYWGLHWQGDAELPYLITLYLGSGVLAGVVVSLLTPREPEWLLDRFYATIWTPIRRDDELNELLPLLVKPGEVKHA